MRGQQRHRRRLQPAHRSREEDQVPHGQDRTRQDHRRERESPVGYVLPAVRGHQARRHARLRGEPGIVTYFADPYSSWQRGGNENGNGIIRRYLSKRSEIRTDMAKEVQEIVNEINNRPMRMLGYRTPAEAFTDELLESQDQRWCCTSK